MLYNVVLAPTEPQSESSYTCTYIPPPLFYLDFLLNNEFSSKEIVEILEGKYFSWSQKCFGKISTFPPRHLG